MALQDSCIGVALVDRATLTVWGLLIALLFLGPARPVLITKCLGYIRKTSGLAVSLEKW